MIIFFYVINNELFAHLNARDGVSKLVEEAQVADELKGDASDFRCNSAAVVVIAGLQGAVHFHPSALILKREASVDAAVRDQVDESQIGVCGGEARVNCVDLIELKVQRV